MAKVALMGHGTVGSGVAEILIGEAERMTARAGEPIEVGYILDLRDFPNLPYAEKFTKDFEQIIADDTVSVVVEVMGGLHPAFEFVSRCLAAGKSVVTSNKELVAAKGNELLALARRNRVNFMFEASVGGGIPIIRPMNRCLAANEVNEIAGILNGTTNFILTKMIKEHLSFEAALKIAQELGYAERNPAADVEGHDTCRKICILSALAFGKHIYPETVSAEGITAITLQDVALAAKIGCVIKLLGHAKRLPNGHAEILTAPYLIPNESPLAGVEDVFNAVLVNGDMTGNVMFYGKGAGKFPTASAVVADVIDCVKCAGETVYPGWGDAEESFAIPAEAQAAPYYLRFDGCANGAKAKIEAAFDSVQWIESDVPQETAATVSALTPTALQEKLAQLKAAGISCASRIRVADFV